MLELLDYLEFERVGTVKTDLGSIEGLRKIGNERADRYVGLLLVPGLLEQFHDPAGRINGVVIAEIPVREEDMAAHLPCKGGAGFLHLCLDERMAGLPHDGLAAVVAYVIVHGLGTFDLGYEGRTRPVAQDVPGEQDHELVAPENGPQLIYDPDAV